jgi:predicted porin
MKKSLIALAAVGAFAGSAMAQSTPSSLTIYGIIDLGVVKQSKADSADYASPLGLAGIQSKALSVAQGTKSRLGFKGVEDLGGGLSAKFELEHRLLPDTGAVNISGGNSFWDKSIVGLTSQTYGEVTLGRDYGPTFYVQYLLDPWLNQGIAEVGGTTYAFAGYVATPFGHNARYDNGLYYKAIYEGLTVLLAAGQSEKDQQDNRYGVGAMYNAGPLGVYFAYDRDPSTINKAKNDHLLQLGAAYDFGVIKPRILYAKSQLVTPYGGDIKPTALTISATVPVSTGLIKLGYAQLNWKDGNPLGQYSQAAAAKAATNLTDAGNAVANAKAYAAGDDSKSTKFSLGYEHTLSKRTALYTDATFGKSKGVTKANVNGVDIGIRHSF